MMRLAAFFAVAALLGSLASAQGLDEATIAPDQRTAVERLLARAGFGELQKSFALVVGVSDFADYDQLPTQNDPIRMRDYLINEADFDYVHILTEEQVTKARLEELILDEFRPMIGENDRFLMYWSGHGETLEVRNGSMGFLPLAQSTKTAFSTMVAMSDLARWNQFIAAHQVLFLLDSCFSGLAGSAAQSDLADITRQQLSGPGRHIITAGRVNEQTIAVDELGGSIFTHALLKGLRGAADTRNDLGVDGLVSVGELKNYLGQEIGRLRGVYNWQKTITPQIRDLSGSDGSFFFPVAAEFTPTEVSFDQSESDAEITPQGGDRELLEMQRGLAELGYDPGPIDGSMNFSTRRALIQFQTDKGLERTGEADQVTMIALIQTLVPEPEPIEDPPPAQVRIEPTENEFGLSMLLVQGGVFSMGSDSGSPEEGPARLTTIAPFYVAHTETTKELFNTYIEEEGLDFVSRKLEAEPTCYEWQSDNRLRRTAYAYNQLQTTPSDFPVSCVNREDIDGFLAWLNKDNEGAPYRLPSEAEFEYLLNAASGIFSPEAAYEDFFLIEEAQALICPRANIADSSSSFAWKNTTCSDGSPSVSPVGQYQADINGLYDIRGNLWEWVSDCWRPTHDAPIQREGCETGTVRGASFDDPIKNLRTTVRQPVPIKRRQTNIGFRLAQDAN